YSDVTERRQDERSIGRLAELVTTADDAIIGQSLDGRIVDWNRGAERLYGYSKDEVCDQPVLRLFAPEGVKEYVQAVQRVQTGAPSDPYPAPQVRKGGQRIIVSMRVSPIESKTGALDGISLIARDIVGAGDRTAPDSDPHSVRGNGGPAS